MTELEDDNDFAIEVATGAEHDMAAPAAQFSTAHRAGVRLLIIDPGHLDSPAMKKLEAAGFACSRVETGSQAMQTISDGQFAALVCVAAGDDDWRRFLAAGVRARHGDFPVLFTAQSGTEQEREKLLAQAATAVLPAPLPDPKELGVAVDQILGIQSTEPVTEDAPSEMALLKRRLRDAEEAQQLKDQEISELKKQFLRAIDEATQRTSESTGLRSEVSILRDRASVMKDRLDRATKTIEWLKQENARLTTGDIAPPQGPPEDRTLDQLTQLQGLLAALLPFEQSLQAAVAFLEELAIVSGPRAPQFQRHVRQLQLLRDVFQRIQARLKLRKPSE
jgi:DNA-binding response OmpR family regulator